MCVCRDKLVPRPAIQTQSHYIILNHLKQSPCLHGPYEDLEGVLRPGTHHLPAGVQRQAGELNRTRRSKGTEVTVPGAERKEVEVIVEVLFIVFY